jgi:hypothetical protein
MTEIRPPPPSRADSARSMAATILLILVGVVLLLPGLCSFAVGVAVLANGPSSFLDTPAIGLIWLAGFAISIGGVLLIRAAIRGRRRTSSPGGRAPDGPRTW